MQVNHFIKHLSKDRIHRYEKLGFTGDDLINAYIVNLEISSSFYIPLHGLEILLRNKVHEEMNKKYGEDWLYDSRLLKADQIQIVKKAKKQVEYEKKEAIIPRVIAALPFSFWEHLFSLVYEDLWRKNLYSIFESPPKKFTRKIFHKRVRQIRRFRNRIAHYECIIHYAIEDYHQQIIETIEWLSPDMAVWTESKSHFQEINQKNMLLLSRIK